MGMDFEQMKLYPAAAPGSEQLSIEEEWFEETLEDGQVKKIVQNVTAPTLIPFFPEGWKEKEAGPACIVIPGGAFRRQVMNLEGTQIAQWLNSIGVAAFVLKCRLPVNDHKNASDVPLMDMQRAIRLIRSNAACWNLDPNRIGVMGFSAGGNFASVLSTCYDRQVYEPIDVIDAEKTRPDFCVLGYPAITIEVEIEALLKKLFGKDFNMSNVKKNVDPAGKGTSYEINGQSMTKEMLMEQYQIPAYLVNILEKYSTDTLVTEQTPPTFIVETDDDKTTLAEHSVRYYLACRRAGVPAELHIFQKGDHGFGVGKDHGLSQTGQWRALLKKWLETNLFLTNV